MNTEITFLGIFAKNTNDLYNLKKFFKNINLDKIEDLILEEIFFESVILDEWEKADKISDLLLKRDNDNFSANLYKFFDGYVKNKNLSNYLENIDTKYLDSNFIKAIYIWKNFNNNLKVEYKPDNCVPIICLHYAITKALKARRKLHKTTLKVLKEEVFLHIELKNYF